MPIVQADNSQHLGDLVKIYTLPVDITDEQQFGPRVINNMNRIVRTEILQNRYNNSTIGDRSQEHCNPVTVVLSHYGDLIVLFHTALLEQNMQFLDVDRQLTVRQGDIRTIIRDSG